MNYKKGFTLVEVLITVLVFGLISYVVFKFTYPQILERKLILRAYEIMQCLTEIRDSSYSKEEGFPDMIFFYPAVDLILVKVFDKKANIYRVSRKIDLSIDGIDLFSANFGVGDFLYFNRLSIPSSGGTIAIGYKNMRKYIIVTPATGRIYISNEKPQNWE